MLPVPFTKITFLKGEQAKNKASAERGMAQEKAIRIGFPSV
jgi:hypothetical protein